MICLPIHTPLPPVHLTFPNKPDSSKVSLIQEKLMDKSSQNSPTSLSKNMHIRQTPTSANSISSTISSHSSNNGSSSQVSNNSTNHPLSDKSIKKRSIDNPYITDNLLYGDPIIEHFYPSSRIIYNNVNGLDLSTHSVTLETMCDYMYMNNVDVACISETNAHWKNPRCYNTMFCVVRKVWKRFQLTTSETSTPWPSIYKPGGTATLTITNLSSRIVSSGEDPHKLGRWSYITFGSKPRHNSP